jgi:two-component system nitrate/nitrite response regulator NarL
MGGVTVAESGAALDVGVIDDHPVVVEGVRAWLSEDTRIRVTHVGTTIGAERPDASLLVLDLNLDGRLVLDEIATLADAGLRIVAFSQFVEQDVVLAALDAGACAFVAKSEGREHLLDTVVAVAADRPHVTPTTAGVLVGDRRPQAPRLSERERRALLWWFQSMSKASVARRMGISTHTVDMFIKRAGLKYARVGRPAPTKADMLIRAIEDGLVRPEEITDYRPRPPQ